MQPQTPQLLPLEQGILRDAIEDSVAEIRFPLKAISIMTSPLDSLARGIQIIGWLAKTHVVIHVAMPERFRTDEIMGLLNSRFGDWKFRVSLVTYKFSMFFFSNMFTYLLLFVKQRATYEEFGFVDEYPMMASVVLFALAMAKPCSTFISIQRILVSYKNTFVSDKYATDSGHLDGLNSALGKIGEAKQEMGQVDWLVSLYYIGEPTISERLERLEKIAREKVEKEDLIVAQKGKTEMA